MANPPSNPSIETMAFVERLMQATKPERMTHLVLTAGSALVLVVCAVVLIIRTEADLKVLGGLFGSTGIVTYSTGQILRIWTDAMRLVTPKE